MDLGQRQVTARERGNAVTEFFDGIHDALLSRSLKPVPARTSTPGIRAPHASSMLPAGQRSLRGFSPTISSPRGLRPPGTSSPIAWNRSRPDRGPPRLGDRISADVDAPRLVARVRLGRPQPSPTRTRRPPRGRPASRAPSRRRPRPRPGRRVPAGSCGPPPGRGTRPNPCGRSATAGGAPSTPRREPQAVGASRRSARSSSKGPPLGGRARSRLRATGASW